MQTVLGRVLGHEKNKALFSQAVQQNRLPHALLLVGPSGVGKRTLAISWAQTLLCERRTAGEYKAACGNCGSCRRILEGASESFLQIQPEDGKATISIEQVRQIVEFTRLTNFGGGGRVILMDQAHSLLPQAANLILKTLEEPPPNTWFFLVTSQPGNILTTIRSRCQRLPFSPLSAELVQQITQCPTWIAEAARGSVEAARTLSHQDFTETRELAFRGFQQICQKAQGTDEAALSEELRQFVKDRSQAHWLLQFWLQFARDVRVLQSGAVEVAQPQTIHQDIKALQQFDISVNTIDRVFRSILQAISDLNGNVDRSLIIDNALLNWARG